MLTFLSLGGSFMTTQQIAGGCVNGCAITFDPPIEESEVEVTDGDYAVALRDSHEEEIAPAA